MCRLPAVTVWVQAVTGLTDFPPRGSGVTSSRAPSSQASRSSTRKRHRRPPGRLKCGISLRRVISWTVRVEQRSRSATSSVRRNGDLPSGNAAERLTRVVSLTSFRLVGGSLHRVVTRADNGHLSRRSRPQDRGTRRRRASLRLLESAPRPSRDGQQQRHGRLSRSSSHGWGRHVPYIRGRHVLSSYCGTGHAITRSWYWH